MADGNKLAQASQIWSMLDDMAENNPSAYRKFIDKHLKEGKELNAPPKPHMCIQTCIASNWIPLYINFCGWPRITKPKDDSAPIPVFGSKLMQRANEEDGEHFVIHVAFNPEVLELYGKTCKSQEEKDALVKLAIAYIEDNNKTKLSHNYYAVTKYDFHGDTNTIREDFGLEKDDMSEELKNLAQTFGPVADIAARDPEILKKMATGDIRTSESEVLKEKVIPDIKIPGASNNVQPTTKLIEEVKITPNYELTYKETGGDEFNRSIVVKIELDSVNSVQECALDVTERALKLEALEYSLDLHLAEMVMEDRVKARFSKTKHQLTVTLPVKAVD